MLRLLVWVLAAPLLLSAALPARSQAVVDPPCAQPGWFPEQYRLKDHHIFWHAGSGYYYLASINADQDDHFIYARSADLCNWEVLPPILADHGPGSWAERAVWAPYVWEENGLFYMAYTGVTEDFTQSILLAVSNDPSDSASWQPQGVIFQPDHAGMLWAPDQWADCRDPVVFWMDGLYYLYYTGRDVDGYIVGLATADNPLGPWTDWGRVVGPVAGTALESPALVRREGLFYLFYHQPGFGERYRIAPAPGGPWTEDALFLPGWAHEVWQDVDGEWWTSYLTTYDVSIAPLQWNTRVDLPRPLIGWGIHYLSLPLVQKGNMPGSSITK